MKNIIIEFTEQENWNYSLDITPEFVPVVMKFFQKWVQNEDIKIEFRIK